MNGRSILFPADTADDLAGTAFIHVDDQLVGAYATDDFASAVRLLDAVAVVADELNHHPDVHLGWASHRVRGLVARRRRGDLARPRARAPHRGELAAEQGARAGN